MEQRESQERAKVDSRNHEKQFLLAPIFGPYSFINIIDGREEKDDVTHSYRNMVEVAIVWKLVRNLYKAWNHSKQNLKICIISPYAAQVAAIEEKVGRNYENIHGFSVKVSSTDGFQGWEDDVVIISTVRSNRGGGSIKFITNIRQKIDVALTSARPSLCILGNERTLCAACSDWEALVHDAKEQRCFFNANENMELAETILEVKKELDQLDDLLNEDSVLLRYARWKVHFSEYFRKSFGKLTSQIKTYVLNLLIKLASGWRPKRRKVDSICERSSQILKLFLVEGLYVVCSVDIVKLRRYTQILKVWDVLPLEQIPGLVERLDGIFETYTDDFIRRCKEKCLEGLLEVPKTWSNNTGIVRYKSLKSNGTGNLSVDAADSRCCMEKSKVSESLLLMKFYSLSSGVVKHLLSDHDGKQSMLPFEVTDEERDIILLERSSFILGRSGTGKTTVLTMKLAKKEQLYRIATEGFGETSGNTSTDAIWQNNFDDDIEYVEGGILEARKSFLRQLFVTVSPKLCYAVKHHVSQLISFSSGLQYSSGSSSASADIDDIDDTSLFKDIPDSFVDIPIKSYPLVVTLWKFLMMLDGTIGISYFERFPELTHFLQGEREHSGSIILQTFIRTREVNYQKFFSVYWPHFNIHLTKQLDSSRVFTEIMSRIKGGLQAVESCDGKLSREDYVHISGRTCTFSIQERDLIYDIFEAYEKKKVRNGDFDMADLVIDLHGRLKSERYGGDVMDYVYIDEVQDFTMMQVALFKYFCKNVNEGFVFSGDTAQTIAKGVDFRFQDIKALFHKEFLSESRAGNDRPNGKGHLHKILQLSQNFRTHAGVLNLAQSIIDLLYCFFRSSVDILDQETSLISGEAPILLGTENCREAMTTIFGSNANASSNFVGFGAEQVILVRDEHTRNEIHSYMGKQAIVLTILECKGLEFQDVMLYNFFGSSNLRERWRVVYKYMEEQDLLDSSSPKFFPIPCFDPDKHYLLCLELKQLYVAITRTRQRLWIFDEDLSNPMFDYWKRKGLVQLRKLENSLVQEMQVASSLEEWKSRGYKLLHEGNYDMAMISFERAGDRRAEKLAKALGLKAAADRVHGSNPEKALICHRQAGEIFESIGKAEYAGECYYMSKEYQRAGRIYLQCGESAVIKAGECFYRAGQYKRAAELYAQGNNFSMCLSACTKGELFDMGLHYIQNKKQLPMAKKYKGKIEQEFLENGAFYYHKLDDKKTMLRYVRCFDSMASIRTFLKKFGHLDELLSLEREAGNFLEAADVAEMKGDLLLKADLLVKAGHFKDASMLVLWYVLVNSLWSAGSKGWPLKHFSQKEKLLTKATSFAKDASSQHYEIVSAEAEILLNEKSNLYMMIQHLYTSQKHNSIRGEILSARKILDAYLDFDTSKYGWHNNVVHNKARFLDTGISIETLVHAWNFWKDRILNIFGYLSCLPMQDTTKYSHYGEFCFNYLGVRRQIDTRNIYLLLNSNASWVRELENNIGRQKGELVTVDVHRLVPAARSYWRSELLSVGMNVLMKLKALFHLSSTDSISLFRKSSCLSHIYDVAKFLLVNNFLKHQSHGNKQLQYFIVLSTKHFFTCIFPVGWRESYMFSLRRRNVSRDLLKECIFANVNFNDKLSYEQLGRMTVIFLGSGHVCDELYEKIAHGLTWNPTWKAFIDVLCRNGGELSCMWKLHAALIDAYIANWWKEGYITPGCFLYLVERQLILLSSFQGCFVTTMSSFIEWFIYQESSGKSTSNSAGHNGQTTEGFLESLAHMVQQYLFNMELTLKWITRTHKSREDCNAVVLRLVVVICVIYLNSGLCGNILFGLLDRKPITVRLPWEFRNAVSKIQKQNPLEVNRHVLYEAFLKIGNRLVIVRLGGDCSRYLCPKAVFVDMNDSQSKQNLWRDLFPKKEEVIPPCTTASEAGIGCSFIGIVHQNISDLHERSNVLSSDVGCADWMSSMGEMIEGDVPLIRERLWEILQTSTSRNSRGDASSFLLAAKGDPTLQRDIERSIRLLSAVIEGCPHKSPPGSKSKSLFEEAASMLDDLRQLYVAMELSKLGLESGISSTGQLLNKLQSRRPEMQPFLNQILSKQDEDQKRER